MVRRPRGRGKAGAAPVSRFDGAALRERVTGVLGDGVHLGPALVRRYASRLVELVFPTLAFPKGPDYGKPGRSGTRAALPDLVFFWNDGTWDLLEGPAPINLCSDQVVEVNLDDGAVPCPPLNGFQALIQRAESKARDEAALIRCPGCPNLYVEIIYREWGCAAGVATIQVQARRLCNTT